MQCNTTKKLTDEEIYIQILKEFHHRMFCFYPITSLETIKLKKDIKKRKEELMALGLETRG